MKLSELERAIYAATFSIHAEAMFKYGMPHAWHEEILEWGKRQTAWELHVAMCARERAEGMVDLHRRGVKDAKNR